MLMKQYVDEKHLAAVQGQCDVIKLLADAEDTTPHEFMEAVRTLYRVAGTFQAKTAMNMAKAGVHPTIKASDVN